MRHKRESDRAPDQPAGDGVADARRLTILHVVAPAKFGGLESVVRALVRGQIRRGHNAIVAAVISPRDETTHPFIESLEAEGVQVEQLRVGGRDYIGERRGIRRLCAAYRPDVVHTHGYRSDFLDGSVARRAGIATVSTCHGFIESTWRGRVYQWLQRRALRQYDAVVAVSVSIEHSLRAAGVPPDVVHRVLNAFAPDDGVLASQGARAALGLTEAPLIGWVGRLSPEKGPDIALEAFVKLETSGARLVMIGDGRDSLVLRERAAMLGVGDRVDWLGAIEHAGTFFKAFDVFLLSSRTEGTPIALLEAMGAEVPIVATAVGGVPDVVDTASAHIVESGDIDMLARALDNVFANRDAARMRAARARDCLARKFAVEPWLARYERVYGSAIATRARRDTVRIGTSESSASRSLLGSWR